MKPYNIKNYIYKCFVMELIKSAPYCYLPHDEFKKKYNEIIENILLNEKTVILIHSNKEIKIYKYPLVMPNHFITGFAVIQYPNQVITLFQNKITEENKNWIKIMLFQKILDLFKNLSSIYLPYPNYWMYNFLKKYIKETGLKINLEINNQKKGEKQ